MGLRRGRVGGTGSRVDAAPGLLPEAPNRVGAVCTEGTGCTGGLNRELLDLFEVAEDPVSGKAAVIYTDTTLDTWTSPTTGTHQLPEIVLAFEQ